MVVNVGVVLGIGIGLGLGWGWGGVGSQDEVGIVRDGWWLGLKGGVEVQGA